MQISDASNEVLILCGEWQQDPESGGRSARGSSSVAVRRCAADNAEIEVIGDRHYTASFDGYMAVRTGQQVEEDGTASLLLYITGHRTHGFGEGIGEVTVEHDFGIGLVTTWSPCDARISAMR